jgi:hypothetical protein
MKTTLDLADNILSRAKKVAKDQNITLRSLVEEGLELALEKRARAKKYRCKPVTVGGQGLSPEFQEGGWSAVQEAIYKGRGS